MYNKSLIYFIALAIASFSVTAAPLNLQDLPAKVMDYIHKKHPKAKEISAKTTTHFGISLYELSFKEEKLDRNSQSYIDNITELFKENGHFFVNVPQITNAVNLLPPPVVKTLQKNYPGYQILTVNLIANPNGRGEEYEIYLQVAKKISLVSLTDQGNIISH